MSNKLTGREAVIALMQGKSVKRKQRVLGYIEAENAFVYFGAPFQTETFESIVVHDDWELVQEPMVWEGDALVHKMHVRGDVAVIEVPYHWAYKRVKVRIEEIL